MKGGAKRRSIRTINYWAVRPNIVLMNLAYAKTGKEDLTSAGKAQIRSIVESFGDFET